MPLLTRTVNTPLIVEIAPGALARLGELLAEHGVSARGEVAAVVGTGLGERVRPLLEDALPGAKPEQVAGGSLEEARRLESRLREGSFDAVVAVGGGGTLDATKWAAGMLGLPFVAVATNLSHDGLASPVAVLESEGHKRSFGVHMPLGVVVDLDLAAESPPEHTRSGIGDVVSNLSALADWRLGRQARGERIDGMAESLAGAAALAVLHHPADTTSQEFLTALAEALVLSGVAMSVAGSSRPCSGACHEISHALDRLFPGTALHGEQVAVGAVFAAWLRRHHLDGPPLAAALDACFARHGVPRNPSDLGLSPEQFAEAVVAAPGTRPDRYTVLEHLALSPEQVAEAVAGFVAR